MRILNQKNDNPCNILYNLKKKQNVQLVFILKFNLSLYFWGGFIRNRPLWLESMEYLQTCQYHLIISPLLIFFHLYAVVVVVYIHWKWMNNWTYPLNIWILRITYEESTLNTVRLPFIGILLFDNGDYSYTLNKKLFLNWTFILVEFVIWVSIAILLSSAGPLII